MKRILFEGLSVDEFLDIITEKIRTEIQLANNNPPSPVMEGYLSREETCKLLRITLPTLFRWTRSGKIKAHKIGGRVLYKKPDVDKALRELTTLKYRSPP